MRTSSPLQHTNQTERDWTSCFVLAANVVAISCTGAIFAFSDSKQEKLEFGLLILFEFWFDRLALRFSTTFSYNSMSREATVHILIKKNGFTHAGFVYVCNCVIFGIQLNDKRCGLKLELLLSAEIIVALKLTLTPDIRGSWNKANC